MKHLLIMAVAGATCAGDEITTLNQDWDLAFGWAAIGQTMVVPDSNVLESFTFRGQMFLEDDDLEYEIKVFEWDEEAQHVVGDAMFADQGELPFGPGLLTHEIGVLLPRGMKVAVVLEIEQFMHDDGGAGRTENGYDDGSFIATERGILAPWTIDEGDSFDMSFSAIFKPCPADIYNDGQLNIFDFLAFQALYNSGDAKADFNGDGVADILDFVAFQNAFLSGC